MNSRGLEGITIEHLIPFFIFLDGLKHYKAGSIIHLRQPLGNMINSGLAFIKIMASILILLFKKLRKDWDIFVCIA
jgi:hypothetical protein